jgi:hypothetical protein
MSKSSSLIRGADSLSRDLMANGLTAGTETFFSRTRILPRFLGKTRRHAAFPALNQRVRRPRRIFQYLARSPMTEARLRHWQFDSDLAGIRESAAINKLPAQEQEACKKLWTNVADLLRKSAAK